MANRRNQPASPQPVVVTSGSTGSGPRTNLAPALFPCPVVPGRKPLPGWWKVPVVAVNAASPPVSTTDLLKNRLREWPQWLASLGLHLVLLFAIWLVVTSPRDNFGDALDALAGRFEAAGDSWSLENIGIAFDQAQVTAEDARPGASPTGSVDENDAEQAHDLQYDFSSRDGLTSPGLIDLDSVTDSKTENEGTRARSGRAVSRRMVNAGRGQGADISGILDGRGTEERARLVKAGGGNAASEMGVELGLKWLARHQRSDGSWSFQHGPDDPGHLDCPTGATGLALLAFLGAGYTHKEGKYMSHVNGGLRYLIDQMDANGSRGWLLGTGQATMYTQGIGAIALCEAYAMTRDKSLRRKAELAIDFIVKAQDPVGGGWRYQIPQAGDTSVVGWQLMALKSAKLIEIDVPSRVIVGVTQFLKSVETDGGASYGYLGPRMVRPSTTAVGLLCRMYLGHGKSDKGLIRGVDHLSTWAPRLDDMYYSYYATQVMHHWGGSPWEQWNFVMRDKLINSQTPAGNAAGSWPTDRSHGAQMGGRLYTTCLSIMTLEVYYRYLPLYRRAGSSGSF